MNTEKVIKRDQKYIMHTYARSPLVLEHGEGMYAYDADGKAYLDFTSGIGVNALGYCHPAWVQAVTMQATRLQHSSNLYYTAPCGKLAKRLCARTGLDQVFFGNSGAEANEGAIKCARKYSVTTYGPDRNKVLTLVNSFHGRTLATLTATGQDVFHKDFGPFPANFGYIPANDFDTFKAAVDDSVCAVMMEMVQGEGGVVALDADYVQSVADYCHAHDILIIVDEVQDSDRSQLEFLEALKGPETKIFAVGDPNQVIYSFRGTTQNMFFLLKNRFQAKELSLPVNYRSNASILEAANRFLQFGGKIQGSNECGEKIQIRNHYDPFQEAMYLADKIWTLHQEGKEYRDIAVFYRLQKQAEILEKMFAEQNIPYEVSVKKSWKDIPVLNWLMYVLRFVTHPDDIQAGMQVLMDKRFGDKCTKKKAEDIIKNHKTEKSDIYKNMFYTEKEVLSGEDIFDSLGLKEALHPTSANYQQDAKQVLDFLNQICAYSREKKLNMSDGVREFLNGVALGTIESPEDTQESAEKEEAGGRVKLMTLHASKGLEFDTVFIIGVNPGLLPIRCSSFDQEEEERRLFFVGITRARNHLELSYYTNPGEPGILGSYSNYLKMIPEELLEWKEIRSDEEKRTNLKELTRRAKEEIRKAEAQKAENVQEQKTESEKTENVQEQKAIHPKYGTGIVTSEDDMMVEVEFPNYGKKQFIKAFQEVEMIR